MSEENQDPKMESDYERARNQILNDSNYTDEQKKVMVKNLADNWKQIHIKVDAGLPEKAKTDVEIAEGVRDSLIQKYADFGLPCPPLDSKEALSNAIEIIKHIQKNEPRESPSGSAPLNEFQIGKRSGFQGNQEGFETREALVDSLRFQEKFGETDDIKKSATEILEQLFRKWISAKKNDPNLVDKIPESMTETPIEHRKRIRRKRKGE